MAEHVLSMHKVAGSISAFSSKKFVVEAVERCGPNVMVCQVVTGAKRWHIDGAYIAPEDEVTMETVVKAIRRKPPGAELMVAGDFNVDILAPEGRRAENIATDLATEGVEMWRSISCREGDGGVGTDGRGP